MTTPNTTHPELMADPFFTLGRIKVILENPSSMRTPSQRIAAAKDVYREWETAKEKMRAAGKTIFIKGIP